MKKKYIYNIAVGLGAVCFLFFVLAFLINNYKVFYLGNTSFEQEKIYLHIPTGTGSDNLKKQLNPYLLDTITFFKAAKKKEYLSNIKAGKY